MLQQGIYELQSLCFEGPDARRVYSHLYSCAAPFCTHVQPFPRTAEGMKTRSQQYAHPFPDY